MATLKSTRPYAVLKVVVSAGGANQVTVIDFPGAKADAVITVVAESAMFILDPSSPDEGEAYDDDKAFPIPTGGYAEFPVSGWAGGAPQIKLSSSTVAAVARVMIANTAP